MVDPMELRLAIAEIEARQYGGIYAEVLVDVRRRAASSAVDPRDIRARQLRAMLNGDLEKICVDHGLRRPNLAMRIPNYKMQQAILDYEFPSETTPTREANEVSLREKPNRRRRKQ